MPEYLSNKKRKQSIGINSYSEYTDTTKIIGNVLVGFGSVGVGTTVPTQDVDVNTIRVRDTLFDYTNSGGEFGYYLVKDTDGIKWVAVPPIDSNAIFVAENNNILGVSSFTGLNIIADELLGVTPNPINPNFADITILPRWLKSGETGIYTTKNVGIGTTIPTTDFQVGFGTTGVTIDGSVGVVSALGYYGNYAFIDQITVNDQLNVVGLGSTLVAAFLASGGGITTTGGDLYVGGSLFADKLDIINLKVVNIEATGITTLNVGIVSTFRVTGVSTLGVTSISQLNVSGITTLGITSTADLFVDENLYVVGIATATRFSTGATGSAINITSNTISGPTEIIIDPADVGDNSGIVRIKGDLYVDGEEFIVNSTTIELADFNVGIASTVGTNLLLDGAGIGIGSTNIRKTLTYDYSSDALKSSENFDLETGKVYKINETEVLSSTQLTVANINATGVSTLGFATIGQLYVSGVSTFVGVGTFIEDLYVGRNLYVADDIFFDELTARNANITGITTLNVGIVSTFRVTGVSTLGVTSTADLFVDGNLRVTGITTLGITSISQLNVSGITTLGITSTTNLTSQQLLVTGITTLGITSTTNLTSQQLNVSAITTLGVTTISQLYVSGVSTFVGVGTFINDLYVGEVLYADVVTGLTSTTDLLVDGNLRVTGITTLGITSISQLNVSGITTLGVTSTTNLTSQQLNVSGITTLGVTSTTNLTSQQLNVSGISTLGVTTISQLYVSGVSTFVGVGTFSGDLYVGGILYAKTVDFDNIEVENIKATGITTLNVGIVSSLTVTGLSTLGVTSTKDLLVDANLEVTGVSTFVGFSTFNNSVVIEDNLLVSGVSTFVGVGTFSGDLYVGGDLYVTDDLVFDEFTARNANITGIGTIETLDTTTGTIDYLTGTNVSYSGIATLGVTSISQLYVSGVSTFVGVGTFSGDLYVGGILYADTVSFDSIQVENIEATGISTLNVGIVSSLTVTGLSTLGVTSTTDLLVGGDLKVTGVSTFVGVGTFSGDLYVGGDLYVTDDLVFDEFTARNANITGIGTIATLDTTTGTIDFLSGTNLDISGIGTIETLDTTTGTIDYLTGTNLSYSGIGTIETLDTTTGTIDFLSGTNLSYSGISTLGITSTTNLTSQQLNVSGITTLGITSTTNLTTQQLNVSGITTLGVTTISQLYVSGVSTFSDRITGIISTATKLENQRTFEITGDVVASPIFFDGTGNVSFAATIQPNSVGLGTDTFGDYVKDITGTANQITVTAGTGEGSTPILSIPNQFNVPQDLIVIRDVQINRDLNVNGNITIGGTAATLFTQTFKVADADIILGVRTDGNGNDISTDNTANHGGIAIASTDGNPLIILTNQGIGETLPATYKKFMWFKEGSFAGLGTDAWLSNYALGVGTTELQAGTVLAAGSVQFSKDDLKIVRNINASGIITAPEFRGTLTGYASSAGIATHINGGAAGNVVYQSAPDTTTFVNNSSATSGQVLLWNGATPYWGNVDAGSVAGIVTYADRAGIAANVIGGIASVSQLYVSGISTLGTVEISSGIITATTGIVTYYGDGSKLENVVSASGYADRAGISTNVIGGIASVSQLYVSGISTLGITSTADLTSQQLNVTGVTTLTSIIGTSLSISGISTIANFLITNVGTGATVGGIGVTYYGDGSQLTDVISTSGYADTAGISTNVIGGIASVTSLNVSGITTLGTVEISSGIVTAVSGYAVTYYGDGSKLSGVSAFSVQQQDIITSPVYPTFASNIGTSSLGIAATELVYIPASGNLGIGTTTPTSKLTVVGDVLVSGILTAHRLYSDVYGEFVGGSITGDDIVGTSLSITGISTLGTVEISSGIITATTGIVTYYGDGSQLTDVVSTSGYADRAGIATYADTAGISTDVIGGIASVTSLNVTGISTLGVTSTTDLTSQQLNVTGITTLSSIVGTSLSITGISAIANFILSPVGAGSTVGGIGVTYYGDGSNLTNVVSTSGYADVSGVSTNSNYATSAGISTYADTAGISTNVIGGIASVTSLNVTGITTLGTVEISSGIITATTGIVTYYGDGSKLTDVVSASGYADRAGIATYADIAGVSTNVIGGIASVTSLNVTGITTLGITSTTNLTSQQLNVTGITTLGITTISELYVSGVSTFVGVGTFSGDLYVGGDLYVTDDLVFDEFTARNANITGITTLNVGIVSSLTVTGITTLGVTTTTNLTSQQLNVSGITTLTSIVGTSLSITGITTLGTVEISSGIITATTGVVTYYGDGSNLTNVVSASGYADRAGISTNVIGGIASVTSLDVSGITTLGTVEISSGIITATTGVVTYYGDGSNLTNVVSTSGYATLAGIATYADKAGISTNVIGGISSVTSLDVSGITTLGVTSTTNLTSQQLSVTGITTLGVTSISELYVSGVSTFVGVGTFSGDLYVGGDLYVSDDIVFDEFTARNANITGIGTIETLDTTTGTIDYLTGTNVSYSGISTLGITSTTDLTTQQLNVTGITTLSSIVGTSLSITGISTLGTVEISSGIITATTGVVTYYGDGSNLTNVVSTSGYADTAGIATNVIGGIASVTSLNVTGITTLSSIVGTSLSISGISTIANFLITNVGTGATVGGIGVTYYGDGSQLTDVVSTSGYADTAGVSTNVIGGIASVTSLNVTGITTLASIVGTSLSITGISTLGTVEISSGIITATTGVVTYYGDGSNLTNVVSTSGYADTAGVSTNVIGGIASVTSLDVSGISTLGSVEISSGIVTAKTGIVTYYGDGSYLTGVSAFSVQQQDITSSPVYPTFASNTNVSSLGIAVTQVAYIPASGNLGIGTTTPTSKLTVQGDVLVSGVLTATRLYSGIYGEFVGGSISGSDIVGTSLSITGISTLGSVKISSGIITSTTGIVTYYGDGSKLEGVIASSSAVAIATNTTNQSQFLTYVTQTGNVTGLGVTTTGLVFNPSINSLGIGTATPRANLDVVGTSLITGISTIANFRMSPVGTGATVGGIGVTYYGDGSNLSGVSAFSVQQQSITASPVYPTFANGVGVSSIGIAVTQVAYIPASGNLGIGTTTPLAKLDVRGDVSIASTLGIGTVIDIVPYDTLNSGTLSWEGSAGQLFSITNNLTTGSIYSVNDVSGIPSIDVDANGTIQLGPYGGNIGLGTTNPTAKLHVVGDVRVSGVSTFVGLVELDSSLRDIYGNVGAAGSILISTGSGVSWSSSASVSISEDNITSTPRYPIFEDITSGTVQTLNVSPSKLQFIPSSGTLSATIFTSLSDRTQKEDIRPIENAIGIVNQLTGVRYNWKNNTNQPSIGLIAQDVEEVIPEVVVEMADGLKSVSYGNIVAVLIEAIKEQQVRIEELEDRLNA